jgi:hypothetical protein
MEDAEHAPPAQVGPSGRRTAELRGLPGHILDDARVAESAAGLPDGGCRAVDGSRRVALKSRIPC